MIGHDLQLSGSCAVEAGVQAGVKLKRSYAPAVMNHSSSPHKSITFTLDTCMNLMFDIRVRP
jgi:hypothetical protein